MAYVPAFVFGDRKYHLELVPSGIYRRDTFESLCRGSFASEIAQHQEQMLKNPPLSEMEQYRQTEKETIDKLTERINKVYSGKAGQS